MMKVILFDIDDTLMDFQKCSYHALKKALRYKGYQMDEYFFKVFTFVNNILWKEYAHGKMEREVLLNKRWKFLFEQFHLDIAYQGFDTLFQNCLKSEYILMDDAIEILEYLYSKYELYVVSNGVLEGQMYRLKHSGIDKYFKGFFISEKIGYPKPQIEFFDYCFQNIDCDKEDIMIIGDSIEADINGGRNAGIHTCFINMRNEKNVDCDYEVYSLKEIKKIL